MDNAMTNAKFPMLLPVAALLLAACGAEDGADAGASLTAADKTEIVSDAPVSPGGPVRISHRVVGTPVVGQPLLIDLNFESRGNAAPMTVDYRINDTTALVFSEQQVRRATITPESGSLASTQQVTVIPQREGRLYLNVSVGIESEMGPSSTVMAIPIQVGEGARSFQQNGTLTTDADGNPVRRLPARAN
jgi:hypothetical protein